MTFKRDEFLFDADNGVSVSADYAGNIYALNGTLWNVEVVKEGNRNG